MALNDGRGSESEDDAALRIPFDGPRALNPIVWRRAFRPPRGQAAMLAAGGLFLLGKNFFTLSVHGRYGEVTLLAGSIALPFGVLTLVTDVGGAGRKPWWWYAAVVAIVGLAIWLQPSLVELLSR